jgi:hypothetical protein
MASENTVKQEEVKVHAECLEYCLQIGAALPLQELAGQQHLPAKSSALPDGRASTSIVSSHG